MTGLLKEWLEELLVDRQPTETQTRDKVTGPKSNVGRKLNTNKIIDLETELGVDVGNSKLQASEAGRAPPK
ncbi:hypothetical protein GWI33_021483 [Rhynchophorus ferrugineus]|uniref:Uncharacterized protein n=1 Tax=Rhynchophorus ferrugineus TaxID=354439 RepID=A0A834IR86_RHYFE|nr:hypothetical protein GWI33_021483 [Rhynchophorus ferrugineus]